MKTEKEIREESRRIRERARGLSGFWIPELAAAAYALEWTLGKRKDIGSAGSVHGRLAESLVKAAEKQSAASRKASPARKPRGKLRRVK